MARERFAAFDDLQERREAKAGKATKGDVRRMKSAARSSDGLMADIYAEGEKAGKDEAKRHAAAKQAKLKARRRKYPRARKAAAHVQQPFSAGVQRGIRQAQAPVAGQVTSATKLAVTSIGVVGLYLFLENATAVNGALGSLSRGVEWLKAPNKSVPYVSKG